MAEIQATILPVALIFAVLFLAGLFLMFVTASAYLTCTCNSWCCSCCRFCADDNDYNDDGDDDDDDGYKTKKMNNRSHEQMFYYETSLPFQSMMIINPFMAKAISKITNLHIETFKMYKF